MVSKLWLIQMALRDENYLFTRRIADRGSDKTVFDSQDRTIQETDPKDVIWDEIDGKEEYPEEGDGYKFQETDSESFIRDENYRRSILGVVAPYIHHILVSIVMETKRGVTKIIGGLHEP